MPGLWAAFGSQDPRSGARGRQPATTGGRPKCMSGRQLARTGTRRHKRRLLGHAASRKVHPRAERRRVPASVAGCLDRTAAPPYALTSSGCSVLRHRAPCVPIGVSAAHGAAGAVKHPVVPHAPSGEEETREDRRALEPDKNRGDDARLNSVIPGRAKREPGIHTPQRQRDDELELPLLMQQHPTSTGDMDSGLAAARRPGMTEGSLTIKSADRARWIASLR